MNSRYEIIIYWSNVDNAYLAEVPELACCMADGASYQEALANAQIVIDDWLNIALETNRFIPEPKGRLLYA
ncbi:MAG: hypothetical protein RL344_1017 [Pseudomonadota bacterium]|jgi:predicted RNase H-like HicB family nuclease